MRDNEVGTDHPLRAVLGDLATTKDLVRWRIEPLLVDAVERLADRP